jgi:hypothetical protein
MSKWIAPLIIVGLACGLAVAFLGRQPASASDEPQEPASVELAERWDGLPVGSFLEQASVDLVVRYPQLVTSLGIGDALGIGDGDLTPLSQAYTQETQALERAILDHLAT